MPKTKVSQQVEDTRMLTVFAVIGILTVIGIPWAIGIAKIVVVILKVVDGL